MQSSISSGFISNAYALAAGNYAMNDNIILPDSKGNAPFWIIDPINIGGNAVTFSMEHNTTINDGSSNGTIFVNHPGFPTPTGMISAYRSNIVWTWTGAPNAAGYKLYSPSVPSPNIDVCAPANCDYNAAFNVRSDGNGQSGGGNGYASSFSVTPGAHDRNSSNPRFLDGTRNVATFDSAYLGNTCNAWSSGALYSVPTCVSSASASLYAYNSDATLKAFPGTGAVINYRYTNGHYNSTSCSGANPQPGLYTDQSRACWEFATLYDLRQQIAAQTLYDDVTIGAAGVDIIQTLLLWIRAGYSPTNQVLSLNGFSGTDIGAVPVSFAPPNPPVGSAPITLRSGGIRSGVLR
jgi:hypothetical protein